MCVNNYILDRLFSMQDLECRDFHSKLMPTIDKNSIIGVRVPALRKLSKDISQTPTSSEFLKILPHKYYEENNIHAFLIERIDDYNTCISELDKFLPYVDNWATCDLMRPKIFKKHLPELLIKIKEWMKSDHPFIIHFGI